MKALVAYFSAESGRTANAAKSLAAAIGADLLEIKPEKPYTSSDLNYMNPLARCNREHISQRSRFLFPARLKTLQNMTLC